METLVPIALTALLVQNVILSQFLESVPSLEFLKRQSLQSGWDWLSRLLWSFHQVFHGLFMNIFSAL